MYRFAYFDAGGTLIRPAPSVGEIYAAAGAPFGLAAEATQIEAAFREIWPVHVSARGQGPLTLGQDDEATQTWWRALVMRVLERVGFNGDFEACFRACYDAFSRSSAWHVFEDVLPTLGRLEKLGVPVGVLSNWDYRLDRLLHALNLAHRFHPIIVSADVQIEKPDPRIFELACTQVGLRPNQVVYVGDQVALDVDPAEALGMRALLIDRSGASKDPRAITTLEALLDEPWG